MVNHKRCGLTLDDHPSNCLKRKSHFNGPESLPLSQKPKKKFIATLIKEFDIIMSRDE